MSALQQSYPQWVLEMVSIRQHVSPEEALELSLLLAEGSIQHGGGPFGAVLTDEGGGVLSVGWNQTVVQCDPTAHAEVTCIRNGCQALQSYALPPTSRLYTSSAPCILCFGAIWWSGVGGVVAGASTAAAEAIGFAEGPVTPGLWQEMKERKGTTFEVRQGMEPRVMRLLQSYSSSGSLY